MANYIDKRKTEESVRTSYFQRGTGDVASNGKNSYSSGDGDNSGGFRPTNIEGKGVPQFVGFGEAVDESGTQSHETSSPTDAPQTLQGVAEVADLTAADKTQEISELISSGALGNSPYFQRIRENQAKLIQLETMPVVDENGRSKSGLKALVEKLALYFDPRYPIRGAGDIYARLTGAVTAGVGGAFVPEWDERSDIEKQKLKIKQENEELLKYGQADAQYQNQQAVLQQRTEQFRTKENRLNRQLDDRIARNKMLNLKADQQTTLEPIFKRGYYYEGDNPDEDAKLAKLNIVLPDFDNTRKPIVENGVGKAWNPETKSYEQMQGTEVDPDDVPMTFEVDGQKITASTKYMLNYKAQKEARKETQNFQADQKEKDRALRRELQKSSQQFGREQTVTKAVEAWKRLYFKENGKNPSNNEIYDYKAYIETSIDTPDTEDDQ